MIELNAGIHPDLTGRENAYLLGAIMGVPRQEMKARMPEIEEFCELGEWFDRPVRQHSSGMLARLGFGVAMHASADVLLIDEVLAVGDFAFQKKCINHMTQLSSSGVTALFVSHNPYIIERMCDRVILLQNGATEELGNPMDVIYRYFQMGMNHSADFNGGLPANLRPGTGDLRIQKVEILSNNGLPTQEVVTGDALTIRLHYMTTESLWEPRFSIRIFDPQNTMVVSLESTVARKGIELSGGGYIDCSVGSFPLMPSVYTFQIKVGAGVTLDMYENAAKLVVRPLPEALVDSGNKGIVYVKADWDYRPRTALTQE
jgi:energy-coupling factor transporter ATP-binding protein EcfA2